MSYTLYVITFVVLAINCKSENEPDMYRLAKVVATYHTYESCSQTPPSARASGA